MPASKKEVKFQLLEASILNYSQHYRSFFLESPVYVFESHMIEMETDIRMINLQIKEREKQARGLFSIIWFTPSHAWKAELGQPKSRSQALHLSSSSQGPKHWLHHLLPAGHMNSEPHGNRVENSSQVGTHIWEEGFPSSDLTHCATSPLLGNSSNRE